MNASASYAELFASCQPMNDIYNNDLSRLVSGPLVDLGYDLDGCADKGFAFADDLITHCEPSMKFIESLHLPATSASALVGPQQLHSSFPQQCQSSPSAFQSLVDNTYNSNNIQVGSQSMLLSQPLSSQGPLGPAMGSMFSAMPSVSSSMSIHTPSQTIPHFSPKFFGPPMEDFSPSPFTCKTEDVDEDGYSTMTDDECITPVSQAMSAPLMAPMTPPPYRDAGLVAATLARRRARSSPIPLLESQRSPLDSQRSPLSQQQQQYLQRSGEQVKSWQRRKRICELPPAQQRRAREMNREAARRNRELMRRERDMSSRRLQTLETLNNQLRNIVSREREEMNTLMNKVLAKLKNESVSWMTLRPAFIKS